MMRLTLILSCLLAAVLVAAVVVPAVGPEPADPPYLRSIETLPEVVSILARGRTLYLATAPLPGAKHRGTFVYSMPLTESTLAAAAPPAPLHGNPLPGTLGGLELNAGNLLAAARGSTALAQGKAERPRIGIFRVPAGGGEVQALWEGSPLVKPGRMVVHKGWLYVADMDAGPAGRGGIFRLRLGGGRPQPFFVGKPLADPVGIAVHGNALWVCDYTRPPRGSSNNTPGRPGVLYRIPLANPAGIEAVARGGLLKNPIDLEVQDDVLFIADEGMDDVSRQGVYSLWLGLYAPGRDLTSSIRLLHEGPPFVQPLALSADGDRLYVGDDTQSRTFVLDLTAFGDLRQ